MGRSRLTATAAALAALVACAGCGTDAGGSDGSGGGGAVEAVLTPESVDRDAVERAAVGARERRGGQAVELRGAGSQPEPASGPATAASAADGISPGAPTDAEVRAELRQARRQLARFRTFLGTTAYLQTGPRARVLPDGTAVAPDDAPEPVKRIIQAGNAIAKFPYKWGGGHGAWRDDGYDCSGSVSFALAGAGLLDSPLTSGGFMDWGAAGPGRGT